MRRRVARAAGKDHIREVWSACRNVSEPAQGRRAQAARTVSRNLATSPRSWVLSLASSLADDSTSREAVPVSPAPRFTSLMFSATCEVPCAACWTLRAISWVAAPCCSTAAAIAAAISAMRAIVSRSP